MYIAIVNCIPKQNSAEYGMGYDLNNRNESSSKKKLDLNSLRSRKEASKIGCF